jgi:GDSL-like Lipase/Acylhydrolase family
MTKLGEGLVARALERSAPTPWYSTDWARFTLVAAQFGLVVLLIRLFGLENSSGLGDLAVLTWVGFVIHHWLPMRARMPFFLLLSLAGLALVAGKWNALWITMGGFLLIGICHLPIRIRWRVGLLLLMGVLIGALSLKQIPFPVDPTAWTLLGSFFMFRLIVYLYDLRHKAAPFSLVRAGAYFFMLPNVCFPLFPLVDYKTFCSTYFNGETFQNYQTGLRWLVRGIIQLLIYRLIYQMALVDPMSVTNLGGVVQFMVVTYLLYLHVSGTFHLIVGLLHLFGFNLGETHHRYLLAGSFLDFWRRANIYWKDFMMKVFFYPAYFMFKGWGPTWALIVATIYAFFATWALHTYQWFWIRGSSFFVWQDMLFWAILGVLVLFNALYEAQTSRQRARSRLNPTFWSQGGVALRTVGTFVSMCVLWTIWNCHSIEELTWLAGAARNVTPSSVVLIVSGLVGLGIAAIFFGRSGAERSDGAPGQAGPSLHWGALSVGLQCAALLIVAYLPQMINLDNHLAGDVLASVLEDRPNRMDVEGLRRGYYEELDVPRRQAQLKRLQDMRPPDWNEGYFQALRRTDDFMYEEPVPSARAFFRGEWVTHNRWGMRNKECEKVKAPGVIRIALLGSSHEYGLGVVDGQTYPAILEELLNRDAGKDSPHYEVLNFALPGHSTFQYLYQLENTVFPFDPDVVLLTTNARELTRAEEHLGREIMWGHQLPFACLRETAERAGVHQGMSQALIRATLRPFMPDLVRQGFQQATEDCRKLGIPVYLLFRPFPHKWANRDLLEQEENKKQLREMAEKVELPFLDLSHAFDGAKYSYELIIAPWDDHTNARGQRLLAQELFRALHDPEGKCLLKPRPGAPAPGATK